MAENLLKANDKNMVVFHIWQSLTYNLRLVLSFSLVILGLVLQIYYSSIFLGLLPLVLANLLMGVKGYDNRINFKSWSAKAKWETVTISKMDELERQSEKVESWDYSLLDITNPRGVILFILVLATLGVTFAVGIDISNFLLQLLAVDAFILIIPQWFFGMKTITNISPDLLKKAKIFKELLKDFENNLSNHHVNVLLRLLDEKCKFPDDIKIRVTFKEQPKEFLGLYGQIVMNHVQGKSYPYFYVVLVAQKGFGLKKVYSKSSKNSGVTLEFKIEDNVEVFIIRQFTTKTSGYHTSGGKIASLFTLGLENAEKAINIKP